MRNFLIFLGIMAVGYLAVTDTIERFNEQDKITVTTPAQIEMKSDITRSKGEGIDKKHNLEVNKPQNTDRSNGIKKPYQTVREKTFEQFNTRQGN